MKIEFYKYKGIFYRNFFTISKMCSNETCEICPLKQNSCDLNCKLRLFDNLKVKRTDKETPVEFVWISDKCIFLAEEGE